MTDIRPAIPLLLWLTLTACSSLDGRPEDVSFAGSNGDLLRATVITPTTGQPPYPAILLLHGAERATRDRMIYTLTANVFLQRGLAVMVYDKRGAGESQGSYEETTFTQLIEDATAALDHLRQRPDIDAGQTGLMGISQSGWLAPEIAERAGDLAFVINKVGAPLSVRETIAWERYNEFLDEGVGAESAEEQTAVLRRIWNYRVSPTDLALQEIEKDLAIWANRDDSQLPERLNRQVSDRYLEEIRYDPTPFLERSQTPMLFVYGSEDINIPTRQCVERLQAYATAGKPFSYHVFDGEGHELGGFSPVPPWYRFAEGFADRLGAFAARHVTVSP